MSELPLSWEDADGNFKFLDVDELYPLSELGLEMYVNDARKSEGLLGLFESDLNTKKVTNNAFGTYHVTGDDVVRYDMRRVENYYRDPDYFIKMAKNRIEEDNDGRFLIDSGNIKLSLNEDDDAKDYDNKPTNDQRSTRAAFIAFMSLCGITDDSIQPPTLRELGSPLFMFQWFERVKTSSSLQDRMEIIVGDEDRIDMSINGVLDGKNVGFIIQNNGMIHFIWEPCGNVSMDSRIDHDLIDRLWDSTKVNNLTPNIKYNEISVPFDYFKGCLGLNPRGVMRLEGGKFSCAMVELAKFLDIEFVEPTQEISDVKMLEQWIDSQDNISVDISDDCAVFNLKGKGGAFCEVITDLNRGNSNNTFLVRWDNGESAPEIPFNLTAGSYSGLCNPSVDEIRQITVERLYNTFSKPKGEVCVENGSREMIAMFSDLIKRIEGIDIGRPEEDNFESIQAWANAALYDSLDNPHMVIRVIDEYVQLEWMNRDRGTHFNVIIYSDGYVESEWQNPHEKI